jgi:hypothetical protein
MPKYKAKCVCESSIETSSSAVFFSWQYEHNAQHALDVIIAKGHR